MKPYITVEDITPEIAVLILDNSIFSMSMIEMNNSTACLIAAMKMGKEAIERELNKGV